MEKATVPLKKWEVKHDDGNGSETLCESDIDFLR